MVHRDLGKDPSSRDRLVERLMTSGGVLAALGVGVFASVQIAANDGVPKINGVQHLALFARPRERQVETTATVPSVQRVSPTANFSGEIDFSRTASIGDRSSQSSRTEYNSVSPDSRRFSVRRVLVDRAIVETNGETIVVRLGETATGVGQLKAIVVREGRYVAIIGPELSASQTSR